jgi:hypothetical protein
MKNNFSFLAAFAMSLFTLCCCMACFKKTAYATSFEGQLSDSLISIKQLKRLHQVGEVEPIQKEWMLQAVVVANDEYDNWYKSIVIQDSTGGIMLLLDGQNLFQDYPIGTLIRLRLKDLLLSDYRRMIQLVGAVDSSSGSLVTGGIPLPLFKQHIQILQDNYPIVPIQVQFKNLHDSLQGRLIQISNIEFSATDTAQTFADKKNKLGASRALKFCTGGTIYLRTSGYANFAGEAIPNGNGSILGVYSVFNSEKQLLIRHPDDILLTNPRCSGAAWLKN